MSKSHKILSSIIGQAAKLTDGREVTIVGFIEWPYHIESYRCKVRYIITTSGARDDDGKRIDMIRKPENVTIQR